MDELERIPSPYEGLRLTVGQHLSISSFWLATNFLWGAMIPLIIPRMMELLAPGKTASTAGWLVSMGAVVALIVPLLAGALSDRCASRFGRRRPFIAVGVGIALIGLAVMASSILDLQQIIGSADVNYDRLALWLFFFGYLILDVGVNISAAAFSGVIPDIVPRDQRGIASGYMALMTFLGVVAGTLVCGRLLKNDQHVAVFVVLGAVLIAMSVVTLWRVKETPLPFCPPKLLWRPYLSSLWISPKKYPDFAWVWLTRALVMFGFYSVSPFLVYFLHDVINVPHKEAPEVAARVLALLIVGAAVTAVVGGAVSDKIGRKKVVYFANALMAGTAFGFAFANNMVVIMVLGFFFGLGYGAYASVDWALGTDVLPSEAEAGKDMAIWHVAQVLPQTISARVGALLLGMFGSWESISPAGKRITHYSDVGYTAMFVVAAVFLLLGAVLLRNVKGAR